MNEIGGASSLKRRSVVAMLWSGADLFMRYGVQLVVAVILARLLSPEEFGTIALLYLFTGIAGVFIDGGFSSALVQKQNMTQTDESSVFWANLGISIFSAGVLSAAAPLISGFFGYPILVPLTGMLAASLVLNALGSIHLVLFSKRLDFKTPMLVSSAAAVSSGALAIWMAFEGFGIWALAWQAVCSSLVSTVLLWCFSLWRPTLEFSVNSLQSLFRFGSYLMLSGLLDISYNRIYSILIGKCYGVKELAYYNRADNTKQIPVDVLAAALSKVAFPVFSTVSHDTEKLRRGVRTVVKVIMFVNLPVMFGLMATAENVVRLLFGEQWLPCVPILQVLCIAGMFWPLHVINLSVLKAQGHSNLFFRLELIKKLFGITALLVGVYFGVMGIAWSQVFMGGVAFAINAYYSGTHLGYGVIQQVADILKSLLVSAAMAAVVLSLNLYEAFTTGSQFVLQVSVGFVFYVVAAFIFRHDALREVLFLIHGMSSLDVSISESSNRK